MVYQAEYPPQGNCKSVIEALIVANNVHEEDVSYHEVGSPRRVFRNLRGQTLESQLQYGEHGVGKIDSQNSRVVGRCQGQHRGEAGDIANCLWSEGNTRNIAHGEEHD